MSSSGRSDQELYALLGGAKRESDAAFAEIYRKYSGNVYRYCLRVMQNEAAAKDIFQDTFLRMLRHAKKEKDVRNLPAFLLRIARNLCLNARRDSNSDPLAAPVSEDAIEELISPSVESAIDEHEMSQLLLKSIELLPEHQREAIMLQTYAGLSYDEIGMVMQVPVSTVRNWIVRGKERLRKIITPYIRTPEEKRDSVAVNAHQQQV
jgi:RNA polymerase sigma factor (sigma-70 family)